jgi:protein-disulfide isomerase
MEEVTMADLEKETSHEAESLVDPVSDADHVRGDPNASVTLVEFGEFECPHCGRAYHALKQLLEEAAGEVRLVFRHFARDEVHPFSERSAQAAEAAAAQGRFWEMHDFLFERQHQLEYADLERHAGVLGLDVERFKEDMRAQVHLPKVRAQRDSGIASGVTETPTFFIEGVKYPGSYEPRALLSAIRSLR